jgi:hypothetical protein
VDTTAGTNDPLFLYSGAQESPAIAWGGDETQGLVVWEDGRNGQSYHTYGLRLEATSSGGFRVLLPLVIKND